jgi:hypothetical protein
MELPNCKSYWRMNDLEIKLLSFRKFPTLSVTAELLDYNYYALFFKNLPLTLASH